MSNYAELYEQVMGFMQQSLTLSDPFPGVAGDATAKRLLIDKLCLRAANNARKRAELLNDWTFNQVSAEVTVPAGESVLLEDLTDVDSGEVFTSFKNVKEITYDGVPIHANSTLHGLRRKFMKPAFIRTRGEFHGKYFKIKPALTEDVDLVFYGTKWMTPYTSTTQLNNSRIDVTGTLTSDGATAVEFLPLFLIDPLPDDNPYRYSQDGTTTLPDNGNFFYIVRIGVGDYYCWGLRLTNMVATVGTTVAEWRSPLYSLLALPEPYEISTWTPEGTATGTPVLTRATESISDWLLVEGFEYMQWATICELNHLLEVYLPRTEGKLPPPDRQREESLESLMRWDTEMRDAQLNMKSR